MMMGVLNLKILCASLLIIAAGAIYQEQLKFRNIDWNFALNRKTPCAFWLSK
jgi:hypothetical protein